MIVGADQRVKDAFQATLRDEPSSAGLSSTTDLDPADVLEVTDLGTAIARAEQVIRDRVSRGSVDSGAPGSSGKRDIFDVLVTDNCPLDAQYRPTLVSPVTYSTRIPPTPQALAQPRIAFSTSFSKRDEVAMWWLAAAVLAPLTFLSLFAVAVQFARVRAAREIAATSTMEIAKHAALTPALAPNDARRPAPRIPIASPTNALQASAPADVPVFDVKSLKTVPTPNKRR